MQTVNLSANPRIPQLVELMNAITAYSDPGPLLDRFVSTMRNLYGRRGFIQLSTRGLPPGEYRILRLKTPDEAEPIASEGFPRLPDHPIHSGGLLSQVIANGPAILHHLDLSADPILGDRLSACQSLMASPIYNNDLGLDWAVLLAPEPDAFDDEDLEEMVVRSNLVGSMLSSMVVQRRLQEANARIHREIETIGAIQRALLPETLPDIPGIHIAASYRTFDRAGGDLYDVSRIGDGICHCPGTPDPRYAILIGDVSGHGPAAAVVMAMAHAILHAYPRRPAGPGEVLAYCNHHLCAKRIDHSFLTAFLAFYNPHTREMVYARAGHNPPLLKDFPHHSAPLHLDAVGDLPLGILPDVIYHEAAITLKPGQTLILYTDGIVEAHRPGGEIFGIEGIEQSLLACTGAPDCAIHHINDALSAHQKEVRPDDDQTIVVMQVVDEAE